MIWKLAAAAVAGVLILGWIVACSRRAPHDDPSPAERRRLDTDVLLERRTILIAGKITEQAATETIAKLLFLEHQDPSAPITLYIDSPGGYVAPSLAIRDTVDTLKPPVYTHCLAQAGGTALVLLAHGTRGHRTATATAHFELTRIHGEAASAGSAADAARTEAILNGMLATDTGHPAEEVARDVASGRQFDVAAARSYGLIDRVEE